MMRQVISCQCQSAEWVEDADGGAQQLCECGATDG